VHGEKARRQRRGVSRLVSPLAHPRENVTHCPLLDFPASFSLVSISVGCSSFSLTAPNLPESTQISPPIGIREPEPASRSPAIPQPIEPETNSVGSPNLDPPSNPSPPTASGGVMYTTTMNAQKAVEQPGRHGGNGSRSSCLEFVR